MKTLLVKVRTVYGEQKVYPINELAQTFAALTGHKTLTPAAIHLIKQLGYEITIQHEEIEL